MIKLTNLTIGYQSGHQAVTVCSGINATLEDGTLACLIGRNGCGKSTLLRTMAGLQKPICGKAMAGDADISTSPASALAKSVSIVLTVNPGLELFTVRDTVGLGRTPYTGLWGILSKEDRTITDKSMELVGITKLADRQLSELSDGERQKAMIAKALAQQTPNILLDEPSAFLDYPSKLELMELLTTLSRQEGKAILLSTHDLDIAQRTAPLFWHLTSSALSISTSVSPSEV